MGQRGMIGLASFLLLLVVASDAYFVVNETQKAVLKQFGKVIETDIEPGFYGKLPFFQKVLAVDGRTLVSDVPPQGFLTAEKKPLTVDAFVIWRVADVQRYITKFSGGGSGAASIQALAERSVSGRVQEALRDEFTKRTVQEVVAGEREQVMDKVASDVNDLAIKDLGIEVIDIRVKQVDWRQDVRDRVFARMRAERNRDAAEHRARGKEEAEKIRAMADRERTVILAEAYRESERTRGEGDAKAASLYADAYNRDREFFRFYRSLQAYRTSLVSGDDILVLEPDSDFFRYLKQVDGNK